MKKNQKSELSPLQRLQLEKRKLKKLYDADGQRLSENWEYLTNNLGSLTMHTIFGPKEKSSGSSPALSKIGLSSGKSGGSTILGNLSAALPVVWEIAQPILFGYMIEKMKSLFSSKKENKKKKGFFF